MTPDHSLESNISAAFPPAPLGKAAKELRRLIGASSDRVELDQVARWPDMVDVLLLEEHSEELPAQIMFLDGAAWRAFLPAWMVAVMRISNPARALPIFGCVMAVLDPQFNEKAPEVFAERVSGLTPPQRTVIAEFVGWASQQAMLAEDPNSQAEIGRLRSAWPNAPAEAGTP